MCRGLRPCVYTAHTAPHTQETMRYNITIQQHG
nr:MAG TPA: hypothetical protein [Caudoviricetes sp.]